MPTLEDALRQQVVLFEKNNRAFHAKQTKASSVAQELFGTKQISSKRRKQAQKFILKAYDELDPVPFALCTCLAITTQSDYATKLDPLSLNEWTRSQQISTELSLSATQIYRNFRASALAAPKSPDDEGGADARSSAATFRQAISSCARAIEDPFQRDAWVTDCAQCLLSYRKLRPPKTPTEKTTILQIARRPQLEHYLGNYIFSALQQSHYAQKEDSPGLTSAARLDVPEHMGDFRLEIFLAARYGREIFKKWLAMELIRDWEFVLGTFLYLAISKSKRHLEGSKHTSPDTDAVDFDFPEGWNSEGDCKLILIMSFDLGREIWKAAY